MNNRTIAGGVLAAVLVLAVWWMFVFSPVRSDATKVDTEIESAKADTKSLEAENAQLEDLEARAPELQADVDRLNAAVPTSPELASFIDAANALGVETGVTWVSVSPTPPAADRFDGHRDSCRWSSRAGTSKSSTTSTASRTCRGSSSSTRCP